MILVKYQLCKSWQSNVVVVQMNVQHWQSSVFRSKEFSLSSFFSTNNKSRLVVFVIACSSLFVSGCGESWPSRVPVSGTVLIDGKPLTSGRIQFVSGSGRAAYGIIDEEGHFSLSTYEPNDGCVLGNFRISIAAFEKVNQRTRRWDTPKKYIDVNKSELTVEIKGPVDDLEIGLTWGGKRGPIFERIPGVSDDD